MPRSMLGLFEARYRFNMPPDGAMNLRGPPMDASAGSPPRIDHITALVSHSETGQYSCRVKQPPPPPLRNGSSAGHIRHSSGDDDDAQNIRRSARASGPRPTGSNPSNSGEVDEQSSLKFASSRKRQKLAGGRMAYPRKRAITACQLCRIRKVWPRAVNHILSSPHPALFRAEDLEL